MQLLLYTYMSDVEKSLQKLDKVSEHFNIVVDKSLVPAYGIGVAVNVKCLELREIVRPVDGAYGICIFIGN